MLVQAAVGHSRQLHSPQRVCHIYVANNDVCAELYATVKFSSCCTWMESVRLHVCACCQPSMLPNVLCYSPRRIQDIYERHSCCGHSHIACSSVQEEQALASSTQQKMMRAMTNTPCRLGMFCMHACAVAHWDQCLLLHVMSVALTGGNRRLGWL